MALPAKPIPFTHSAPIKHGANESGTGLHLLDAEGSSPDVNMDLGTALEALARVGAENAELRDHFEENEQLLHAAVASEEVWLERQKEYETLLEEKSDVIRNLHQKIQELQQGSAGENHARAEQLEKLQKEFDARQQRLAEDEQALVSQMRAMEMSLSRDRAELARQRNEVQRLHADIQREIDLATRDSSLRERLASLARRAQDGLPRRTAPKTETFLDLSPGSAPAAEPPSPLASSKRARGLLRRVFGW